jgi:hypothetical protein
VPEVTAGARLGRILGKKGVRRVFALGSMLALALALAGPAIAELQGVGSEVPVGVNATGEPCRLRVVQEEPARGYQRSSLYCEGWSASSGTLQRFRVSREYTPERLLTHSAFQKGYETRLGHCGPVEATAFRDGTVAGLRPCTRLERGWPVVAAAAVAGGRGYGFETFPTNVRAVESAIALQGRVERRDGQLSAAFIGFADPDFAGSSGARRSLADLAVLCRQGETVDPALLRALPRLRESGDEVKRIAAALGAPAAAVVFGPAATERRVRETDLSRYRVVAFATHGLLPDELRCQNEPALALMPPSTPTKGDNGLLDASEVATLKLDADWVVLSACNTAGPDGSLGGESLSGLTRAFFYAGARALLVSHWAVASGPTVDLTTAMFRESSAGGTLGKAEALRRAQAALRARPQTAHPFFWAPFVVVGDGGPAAP